MITFTVIVSDEDARKLEERVSQLNLSVAELLRVTAQNLSSQSEKEFERAMEYVLQKNEELYRRLS